jgi:hypothetical protein
VNGGSHPEVWAIRAECWRLLEDLRAGDVDAETGEQMVSVLDTLVDLARLEGQEAEQEKTGKQPSTQRKEG